MDPLIKAGALAMALLAIIGLLTAVQKGARWMLRTLRKLGEFLEDWNGEPGRPGVPARPGVMARLERIEAQLNPNGGQSLHDKVTAIKNTVVDEN